MNRLAVVALLAAFAACERPGSPVTPGLRPPRIDPAPRAEPPRRAEPSTAPVAAPAPEPVPRPQDPSTGPGLIVERRVRAVSRDLVNKASETHRREVVRIQDGRVAIDDVTFGTRLVIRPDRRLAWAIDLHGGTYSELTFESIAQRRERVIADLLEARRRVAGTQDAQDIERIVAGLGHPVGTPAVVEVRDKGTSDKVAGRACVGREVRVGADLVPIDVLVDPAIPEGPAYFAALAAVGAFHPALAEKLKDLGGFPMRGTVRTALFLDRITSDEEVTAVARGDLPPAAFELPAGLKRVPRRGFDPDAGPKPEKPKAFEPSFREDEIDRENNPLKGAPEKKEPK